MLWQADRSDGPRGSAPRVRALCDTLPECGWDLRIGSMSLSWSGYVIYNGGRILRMSLRSLISWSWINQNGHYPRWAWPNQVNPLQKGPCRPWKERLQLERRSPAGLEESSCHGFCAFKEMNSADNHVSVEGSWVQMTPWSQPVRPSHAVPRLLTRRDCEGVSACGFEPSNLCEFITQRCKTNTLG